MTDVTGAATNNLLNVMALGAQPAPSRSGRTASSTGGGSWFEALAEAWGSSLDNEAQTLQSMSNTVGQGNEEPSQIAQLSAESLRMSFMAQSENTSISAAGSSLQTMARKD